MKIRNVLMVLVLGVMAPNEMKGDCNTLYYDIAPSAEPWLPTEQTYSDTPIDGKKYGVTTNFKSYDDCINGTSGMEPGMNSPGNQRKCANGDCNSLCNLVCPLSDKTIQGAYYGTSYDQSCLLKDVTSTFKGTSGTPKTSQVTNSNLGFATSDPCFGQIKTLFLFNGSGKLVNITKINNSITTPGIPTSENQFVTYTPNQVARAYYGLGYAAVDITDQIKNAGTGTVSNSLIGYDFAPGIPKKLFIKYVDRTDSFAEGSTYSKR